jgi:magnesium transporter
MPESQKISAEDEKHVLPADEHLHEQVGLSDETIQDVEEHLEQNDHDAVGEVIAELNVADTAELLSKLCEEDRALILEEHGDEFTADVFTEMEPTLRKQTLEAMGADQLISIVSEVESDDALDLIEDLSPRRQAHIIEMLSGHLRLTVEQGLSFPEESAGRLMQREFVAIPEFWTVGQTIDYLRDTCDSLPNDFFDVFVISPTYHVLGEIPLNRIVRSKREVEIKNLTLKEIHPITATMDQEEVARLFRRENLVSAPVVDEEDRLIGVITIDDVVDVIDEEAEEDLLKMAGISDSQDFHIDLFATTKSRFRWLFLNLLTAIAASIVIGLFDATIQQVVALAILMPIVASMGGNAGTQALTVAVRALATRQLSRRNALQIIWKETLVGTMNGSAFAIIMGLIAGIWFSNPMLGIIIAVAMIINLVFAGLCGAGIPIALHRMGADPAVSSTVFLTTVTDIVGFFAFLGLAAVFMV